jgi:hypothetical protein
LTGNDTVEAQRTQVIAKEVKAEKWFDTAEQMFLEMSDPSSRKMRNIMQGYWTKQDSLAMQALFASTVTRVAGDAASPTTTAAVSMPATQVLGDTTYADIDWTLFTSIKKRFQKNLISGETIYVGFGPTAWEAMMNNSGDKLVNQDYVSSAEYFTEGKLPKAFGCVPIVHEFFENSTVLGSLMDASEDGLIAAWTEEGMAWCQYGTEQHIQDTNMAAFKGQSVSFIKKFVNAARIDDLRVMNGAILAP